MKSIARYRTLTLSAVLILGVPAMVVWIIAGSDSLFLKTVPIEQRLVSHDEAIRTHAQQELLGLAYESKKNLTSHLLPAVANADPVVRKWAVIALALMGPAAQEAIPALLHGVSSGETDVAQACRVALSEIGAPDPEQLPALTQSLQDNRPAVRCEAATTIAKLGIEAHPALPLLMAHLHDNAESFACIGKALAKLSISIPEIQNQLLGWLENPASPDRRHASYVLAEIHEFAPSLIERMLRALANEEDADVRKDLARALSLDEAPERGNFPSWTYALRKAAQAPVRLAALHLLQASGSKVDQLGEVLWQATRDDNAEIRLEAVEWLGRSGSLARPAFNYLLSAIRDKDVRVRRAAFVALKESGSQRHEGLQLIAKAQRDADPQVRCLAAEELIALGSADRVATALLLKDLEGEVDNARCAGEALSLAGHFNHDVVPALIKVLQDENSPARSRAALVLMQLGGRSREAIPALIKAQKDQIPDADIALKVIRESLPAVILKHRRRERSRSDR